MEDLRLEVKNFGEFRNCPLNYLAKFSLRKNKLLISHRRGGSQ